MYIEIGPEFQYLGGEDNNSNAYRNRARISVFRRIRSVFQFFLKMRPEQQLKENALCFCT